MRCNYRQLRRSVIINRHLPKCHFHSPGGATADRCTPRQLQLTASSSRANACFYRSIALFILVSSKLPGKLRHQNVNYLNLSNSWPLRCYIHTKLEFHNYPTCASQQNRHFFFNRRAAYGKITTVFPQEYILVQRSNSANRPSGNNISLTELNKLIRV